MLTHPSRVLAPVAARLQLYLALYLELVPLPPVVQAEIVPVVRRCKPRSHSPPLRATLSAPPCAHIHILRSLANKLGPRAFQLPFWLLVSFGAYLLFRLGWGVLTFNDVPDAHKELMGEIAQAKVELRALGVDVD